MKIIITHPLLKKFLLAIFLLNMFCFSINTSFAQMSGMYDIGPSGDYTNFSSAITAIDTNGVNGAVTFNVKGGTYSEQITINFIQGASSINTITFQPDSIDTATVILRYSPDSTLKNWTIKLDGAEYIIFKDLTITTSDIGYGSRVIEIAGGASNNQFIDNIIIGSQDTAADELVYSGTSDDNTNLFTGNLFKFGSYGLYLNAGSSETGTYIENNQFQNQRNYAIYLNKQNAPVVKSNIILGDELFYNAAIYLNACLNKIDIEKNNISIINANQPIGIYYNSTSTPGNEGIIANNFISVQNGSGIISQSSSYNRILHNTINIKDSFSLGAGIRLNISSFTYVYNNICANEAAGYAVYYNGSNNIFSDNNCFYSDGSNLVRNNANVYSDLFSWIGIGYDTHSVSTFPTFETISDLHLRSGENSKLKRKGRKLPEIIFDIDGDGRNPDNPDIGADEFLFLDFGNDTTICGASYVLDAGSGYSNYEWKDSSNNQKLTITTSGLYWAEIRDELGHTFRDSINITLIPGPKVILQPELKDEVFLGDSITLSLSADTSVDYYQWYKDTTPVDSAVDSVLSLYIDTSAFGDYYCVVTNDCGGDTSDVVVVALSNFGKITGTVYHDITNDCYQDSGEDGIPGRILKVVQGPFYTSTDTMGNFEVLLLSGNYDLVLSKDLGKYTYWELCNGHTGTHNVQVSSGNIYPDKNFGTRPKPNILDLNVNLIPIDGWKAHRGYENDFTVQFSNYGSETVSSGTVEFTHDSKLTYISASSTPTINGNVLSWNYTNLLPQETRNITVYLNNPVSLSMGDTLYNYANISPQISDSNIFNNYDTIVQTVVVSMDPNDKQSFPEGDITQDVVRIDYLVRFQNVGTASARRVTVIDTLDMILLDKAAEFVLIKGATHPYILSVENNVFKWTFNNIMLPDSITNEPESHGSLRFSVSLLPDLGVGTEIRNKAYIYFDYELPIRTNIVLNKIIDTSNSIELPAKINNKSYNIYPIPANDILFIENLKETSDQVSIYNQMGQLIDIYDFEPNRTKLIDTQYLSEGIYILVSHGFAFKKKILITH